MIHPGSNLLGLLEYNLLNSSVALFGYYFAAFTIDRLWMGRRRMQVRPLNVTFDMHICRWQTWRVANLEAATCVVDGIPRRASKLSSWQTPCLDLSRQQRSDKPKCMWTICLLSVTVRLYDLHALYRWPSLQYIDQAAVR